MGLITVQIDLGFGRPGYYLTQHQYQEFMKYSYGEWLQVSILRAPIDFTLNFDRPLRL